MTSRLLPDLEQQKGFDLAVAGGVLALGDLFMLLGRLSGGFFADWMLNSPNYSGPGAGDVNWIRRTSIMVSRGMGGFMALLLSLDAPTSLLIVLLCIYNFVNVKW